MAKQSRLLDSAIAILKKHPEGIHRVALTKALNISRQDMAHVVRHLMRRHMLRREIISRQIHILHYVDPDN
jgi:hypothetical protein